jgi:hyaluronoglucosaminidase
VAWPIAGIIEGFYGRPWTWDERAAVMRACHSWGMTHYVYAPKDDPKHRQRWRDPYGDGKLGGFARLVGEGTLRVGFGISPGLSIDCSSRSDRAALGAKVDQVLETGIDLVVLALDDIPFGGADQGVAHAALTTWLREHLGDRASLVLVPTEYVGTASTPYLDALADGVPFDVPIAWTGPYVVNASITAPDARQRAESLAGRRPLVWDNFPVNDAIMADRLHLGPLFGRDPALADECCGYLANPMVQPNASLLPLASVAAWLRGDDPIGAWLDEADARGWRTFAEACDGAVPMALVQDAVDWLDDADGASRIERLHVWLDHAAQCTAPGLEDEAGPWLDQVRVEAKVGLEALRLLALAEEGKVTAGIEHAFGLGFAWSHARKGAVSALGARFGLQPVLGQRADGRWTFEPESIIEGANAIDVLVRAAFASFSAASRR